MKAYFQQHQDLLFLLIQRLNNFVVLFYLKFWKNNGKIFTKHRLVKKVPLHQKYPSETGEAANDCWKNISVFMLFQWKYLYRRSVLKHLSCFPTKDTGIEKDSYSSGSARVGRCPVPFMSLCAGFGVLVPLCFLSALSTGRSRHMAACRHVKLAQAENEHVVFKSVDEVKVTEPCVRMEML